MLIKWHFKNKLRHACICAGIEPWTFEQKLGEAVLIPAGCPHQVRNLKVYQGYAYSSINMIVIILTSHLLNALWNY